jgi:hypothetical protein
MLRHYKVTPLLYIFLGGTCMSFSSGYDHNRDSPSRNIPEDVRPGVSDDRSNDSWQNGNQSTGREQIAYNDELDRDIHRRAYRMGDWGNRQNWRYDRRAFFRGETQPENYEEQHPYGPAGIGYDADTQYLQMRQFYREDYNRNRQNNLMNRNRGYRNHRENDYGQPNGYQGGYANRSNSNRQANSNQQSYAHNAKPANQGQNNQRQNNQQQANANRSNPNYQNVGQQQQARDDRAYGAANTNLPHNANQNHYTLQNGGGGYVDNRYSNVRYPNELSFNDTIEHSSTYYPNDGDSNFMYDWSKYDYRMATTPDTFRFYGQPYDHYDDNPYYHYNPYYDDYSWQQ